MKSAFQLIDMYYEKFNLDGYRIVENKEINYTDFVQVFFINFCDDFFSSQAKKKIEMQ